MYSKANEFYGHEFSVEQLVAKSSDIYDDELNVKKARIFGLDENIFIFKSFLYFAAFLVVLFFVTYHVISKLRGNEKNASMNNYGIGLSSLGLVYYAIIFTNWMFHLTYSEEYYKYTESHPRLSNWIGLITYGSYMLFHWLFNWRYLKSAFRLPVLEKIVEFHNEMLEKVISQREEQEVLFTASELEENKVKIVEIRDQQKCQEYWFIGIELFFLALMGAAIYPYIHGY